MEFLDIKECKEQFCPKEINGTCEYLNKVHEAYIETLGERDGLKVRLKILEAELESIKELRKIK